MFLGNVLRNVFFDEVTSLFVGDHDGRIASGGGNDESGTFRLMPIGAVHNADKLHVVLLSAAILLHDLGSVDPGSLVQRSGKRTGSQTQLAHVHIFVDDQLGHTLHSEGVIFLIGLHLSDLAVHHVTAARSGDHGRVSREEMLLAAIGVDVASLLDSLYILFVARILYDVGS